MFTDPLPNVTINTVAQTLPRIRSDLYGAEYMKADGNVEVQISHNSNGKRRRHLFRLSQKKVAADPFIPAQNVEISASVHIVVDEPVVGFDDTELGYLVTALKDWVAAGTNTARFVGGES
jgi:hypothetical protein